VLDRDLVKEIVDRSPRVDPTAVERSREIVRKLAEVGVKIGEYRLQPPLGGALLKHSDQHRRPISR